MNVKKYSLKQIRNNAHPVDSFWTVVFVNPFANRLVMFFANYTLVNPSTITLVSFIFSLASVYFFLNPSLLNFFVGGLFFQIGFLFDCVDGKLARLTERTSKKGAFFDSISDTFALIVGLLSFSYGLSVFFSNNIFILISAIYISNHWMEGTLTQLSRVNIKNFDDEKLLKRKLIERYQKETRPPLTLRIKYLFWQRGIRMRFDRFFSEGLLFFIIPLAVLLANSNAISFTLFLGTFIFVTLVLVLSTFVDGVRLFKQITKEKQ